MVIVFEVQCVENKKFFCIIPYWSVGGTTKYKKLGQKIEVTPCNFVSAAWIGP